MSYRKACTAFLAILSVTSLLSTGAAHGSESLRLIASMRNDSGWNMSKSSDSLDWGKWVDEPDGSISKGSIDEFESRGRSGSATGTQGKIEWAINSGNGATVTLKWDVPFKGANQYSIDLGGKDAGYFRVTCDKVDQSASGYLKLQCYVFAQKKAAR